MTMSMNGDLHHETETDAEDEKAAPGVQTTQFNLRVGKGQLAFWQEAAAHAGLSVAAWVKIVCTEAAAKMYAEHATRWGKKRVG